MGGTSDQGIPPASLLPLMSAHQPLANTQVRSEDRTDLAPVFAAINQPFAKPGPYTTQLAPHEEAQFQAWAAQHQIPTNDPTYDNRGFWKAMMAGDPLAKTGFNPTAGEVHGPDIWKTPFDPSFSNESIYAKPNAPHWEGRYLVDAQGNKLFDDKTGLRLQLMSQGDPLKGY